MVVWVVWSVCNVLHNNSTTSQARTTKLSVVAMFWGQKIKGNGHRVTKC